jgi:Mg/Co/Ni transporter MgtE
LVSFFINRIKFKEYFWKSFFIGLILGFFIGFVIIFYVITPMIFGGIV